MKYRINSRLVATENLEMRKTLLSSENEVSLNGKMVLFCLDFIAVNPDNHKVVLTFILVLGKILSSCGKQYLMRSSPSMFRVKVHPPRHCVCTQTAVILSQYIKQGWRSGVAQGVGLAINRSWV